MNLLLLLADLDRIFLRAGGTIKLKIVNLAKLSHVLSVLYKEAPNLDADHEQK